MWVTCIGQHNDILPMPVGFVLSQFCTCEMCCYGFPASFKNSSVIQYACCLSICYCVHILQWQQYTGLEFHNQCSASVLSKVSGVASPPHRSGHEGKGPEGGDHSWQAGWASGLSLHVCLLTGCPQLSIPAGWRYSSPPMNLLDIYQHTITISLHISANPIQ